MTEIRAYSVIEDDGDRTRKVCYVTLWKTQIDGTWAFDQMLLKGVSEGIVRRIYPRAEFTNR